MTRVDAVWDTYPDNSIKNQAHAKRGYGQKTKVTCKTLIPKDWQNFLKNRENKIQLFALLSEALARSQIDKTLLPKGTLFLPISLKMLKT